MNRNIGYMISIMLLFHITLIISSAARTAVVWMDEYKDTALQMMHVPPGFNLGPLEYMIDLRKRLQCKPFKW